MPVESAPAAAPVQLIAFRLAGESFAIPVSEVREVIRAAALTPVPGSPDFIRGMINVRGEIAAVVDLKARLAMRPGGEPPPKHVVITAQGKNLFALLVDEVTEVLRTAVEEVKPAPAVAARAEAGLVTGVVMREGRLIVLLDLARLLSEEALAGPARRPPASSPP